MMPRRSASTLAGVASSAASVTGPSRREHATKMSANTDEGPSTIWSSTWDGLSVLRGPPPAPAPDAPPPTPADDPGAWYAAYCRTICPTSDTANRLVTTDTERLRRRLGNVAPHNRGRSEHACAGAATLARQSIKRTQSGSMGDVWSSSARTRDTSACRSWRWHPARNAPAARPGGMPCRRDAATRASTAAGMDTPRMPLVDTPSVSPWRSCALDVTAGSKACWHSRDCSTRQHSTATAAVESAAVCGHTHELSGREQ